MGSWVQTREILKTATAPVVILVLVGDRARFQQKPIIPDRTGVGSCTGKMGDERLAQQQGINLANNLRRR
jgi:hypothetical protein